MYVFQLFRWKNLLLIAFTQIVIWVFLSKTLVEYSIENALSFFEFSLLSLCTILIAGGGYVINDVYDVEIDKINKFDKMIVSKHISKKHAMQLYLMTLIVALGISVYLAIVQQRTQLLWIPPIISVLLFAYAKRFKRGFLWGNIIVSIFVAAVPGIVILGESEAITKLMLIDYSKVTVIGTYIGFAFLINFIREIVKDIEDMEGDAALNCKTIPIALGQNTAVNICVMLFSVLALLILTGIFLGFEIFEFSILILAIVILLLIVFLIFKLKKAESSKAFHNISSMIKLIMLLALIGLIFYL